MESSAQKNKEYLNGIAKLWQSQNLPEGIKQYLDLVEKYSPDKKLSQYPGSPLIAAQLLEDKDRLFCYELHPVEFKALTESVKRDKRFKIFRQDGLLECLSLLPPKERRGVVLIDPSYEIKDEYRSVVRALVGMYEKFSTGCYLLWYPVVNREQNLALEKAIKASGITNIQLYELGLEPDNPDFGMTACGMIVVNPPWILHSQMEVTLPWLVEHLSEANRGYWRIDQLVQEKA